MSTSSPARTIPAPRGSTLSCKTWQAEAAMRMLMNNLDPEVAELPENLIVYGGRGQAARSWRPDAIIRHCRNWKPIRRFLSSQENRRCRPDTCRRTEVMIANSNLVPHWATQEHFDDLSARGLMMYGQMTAGSWIYIGTQGILQGTTRPSPNVLASTLVERSREDWPSPPAVAEWVERSRFRSR